MQQNPLNKLNINVIISDKAELNSLKRDTELIIYDFRTTGMTLFELEEWLVYLVEKNIRLRIINSNSLLSTLPNDHLISIILELVSNEREIIRKRTKEGLEEAKSKGRYRGRPRVSKATIERIQFLYKNEWGTLRDIASECEVSLGTVYKYANIEKIEPI